jgi:hypothetical protein
VTRRTRRITVLISVGAVWSVSAATGQAAETPRHQLVRVYAPIVMLRAQEEDPPCDSSEELDLSGDPLDPGCTYAERFVALRDAGRGRFRVVRIRS